MRSINSFVIFITLAFVSLPSLCHAAGASLAVESKDGVKMVLIPEGSYDMGTDDEDMVSIAPLHRVYISSFYMDQHTVTNGQFAKYLNDVRLPEGPGGLRQSWVVLRSDLETKERKFYWPTEIAYEDGKYVAYRGYRDYPVITISWTAAEAYCKWAGKRLPTEAEWEKAARGGLPLKSFPWGDEIPTSEIIHSRSWKSNKVAPPVSPSMSGKPNGYGLFNMAGNVWEWCNDWFQPDYYGLSNRKDPQGPVEGEYKVLRGGAWFNPPPALRVSARNYLLPFNLVETTGFRCARDAYTNTSRTKAEKDKVK